MFGITTALGRAFLVSGLIPSFVFIVMNVIFLADWQLDLKAAVGTDGVEIFPLVVVPLAVILLLFGSLRVCHSTAKPTPRWTFQVLEGIHRVTIITENGVHVLIEGLEKRTKILNLYGHPVCRRYQISFPTG